MPVAWAAGAWSPAAAGSGREEEGRRGVRRGSRPPPLPSPARRPAQPGLPRCPIPGEASRGRPVPVTTGGRFRFCAL